MKSTTQNFSDFVRQYAKWKLNEKGTAKINREELRNLREAFSKQRATTNEEAPKSLRETVIAYKKYKREKTGSSEITREEFKKLREAIKGAPAAKKLNEGTGKRSFATLVANYKEFKSMREGKDSRLTYKEMRALHEAYTKAGGRLREADQGFDPTGGMGGDPNAMAQPGMDPNGMPAPAAQVDPTIASQIQDVKNSVDALATAAGIQTTDFNGDPNAAVPAVDGMAQPAAAPPPPQQMVESLIKEYRNFKYKKTGEGTVTKRERELLKEALSQELGKKRVTDDGKPKSRIDSIRERIAKRQAELAGLKENAAQDLGKKVLSKLGGPQERASFRPAQPAAGSTDASEELVKVPSAGALAKGMTSGKGATVGKTWPTKSPKDLGALQGKSAEQKKAAGENKIYEDEEGKPEGDHLTEGAKSVTDSYVERELSTPKLDFTALKQAISTGLLG
jgi:hypothetical protein